MSEKRFTFGAVSPNVAMIKDNGEPMNIGEVVDKLNELYEEMKRFGEHSYKLEQYNLHYLNENTRLKKDNEKLQQLVNVSMNADEVFSVFDDLKYIESALTFLIDNGLEDQCVECEREDIHFVAERLRIVLRSLDDE